MTDSDAPFICHCLMKELTFLSIPASSSKCDISFLSVSFRYILGANIGCGFGMALWIITNAVAMAAAAIISDGRNIFFFIYFNFPDFFAKSIMKSAVPSIPSMLESMQRSYVEATPQSVNV